MNSDRNDCKEIYFSLIINEINKVLKKQNIIPYIQAGKDFSLIPGYTAPNLFSVLYIQFFQMVTQEKSNKKCLYCGSYFIPQSKNKIDKFCPDDNNEEKHSICNIRYNSMKNKNIIKINENKLNESKVRKLTSNIKWTDREDKTHYGRPYREVKSWIENYEPRSNKTKKLYKEYMNSDNSII